MAKEVVVQLPEEAEIDNLDEQKLKELVENATKSSGIKGVDKVVVKSGGIKPFAGGGVEWTRACN